MTYYHRHINTYIYINKLFLAHIHKDFKNLVLPYLKVAQSIVVKYIYTMNNKLVLRENCKCKIKGCEQNKYIIKSQFLI